MKNTVGRFVFLDFKTYHKAKVIKSVQYWGKEKHTDQRNKKDS